MNNTAIPQHAEEAATIILATRPILADKIARALDCDDLSAREALIEVIRFLQLVAQSESPLTPSHKVDLAWHEFILCTRAYHGFCQETFGEYIHHTPGGSRGENHSQYRRTLEAYAATYGPPSIRYWDNPDLGPAASDCGSCETAAPFNLVV